MKNWFNIGGGTHSTNTDRGSHDEINKEWFETLVTKLLDSNREISRYKLLSDIVWKDTYYFINLTLADKFRFILEYSLDLNEVIIRFPDDWYEESIYSANTPIEDLVNDINDELALASSLLDIRLNRLAYLIKRSLTSTGYAKLGKELRHELTGFYTPTGNHQHRVTLTLTSSIYGSYELTIGGSGPSVTTRASRYKVSLEEISQEFVKFIEDQAQDNNTNHYATMSNKHKGVLDITVPDNIHEVNIKGATTGVKVNIDTLTGEETTEATQTTGLSLDVIASELTDTLAYGTKYQGLGVNVRYVNTDSENISGITFTKNLTEHKFAEHTKRPFNLVWNSERKRAFLSVSGNVVEGTFKYEDELNEKTVASWAKSMLYNYTFFGSFLNDH